MLIVGPPAPYILVWCAVAMDVDRRLTSGWSLHVYIAIFYGIGCYARANLYHLYVLIRAILQAVSDAIARLESCSVTGHKCLLVFVGHECDLSRKHVNELVRIAVPMALARPRPRR